MPALPELGDVAGEVGQVKVGGEVIAQAARRADGHVRIAGEVKVNLQRIGDYGQRHRAGAVRAHAGEHRIHEYGEVVRQHRLFQHAEEHLRQAAGNARAAGAAFLFKLRQKFRGLDDRPGHQLREKGDVERELHRVVAGGQRAAVDVDGVAQALEGVKGDAHRQYDVQRAVLDVEKRAEAVEKEVRVLEIKQHRQRHAHAHGQYGAAPGAFFHGQPRQVGHRREQQHQSAKAPVPPAVEYVAGDEQRPLPGAGAPEEQLREQHEGKEDGEYDADEIHARPPSASTMASYSASATRRCPSALRWPWPMAVLAKPWGRMCSAS